MDITVLLLLIALPIAFTIVGIARFALLVKRFDLDSTLFDKAVEEAQKEEPRLKDSPKRAARVVFTRMVIAAMATSLFGLLVSIVALFGYVLTLSADSDIVWQFPAVVATVVLVYAGPRLLVYRARYNQLYRSKCQAQRSTTS